VLDDNPHVKLTEIFRNFVLPVNNCARVSKIMEGRHGKFNVLLTVHRDISVQREPRRCTVFY